MSLRLRWVGKKRNFSLEGGTVLDGFPSAGLVSAIATECLIRSLETELVAVLDSDEFPSFSIVTDHRPQFPARVYVNEALKTTFFVSELEIYPPMQKAAARIILQWMTDNRCKFVISSSGILAKSNDEMSSIPAPESHEIHALGSTNNAVHMIADKGFELYQTGTITGIPAALLNEGSLIGLDVIVILVNTSPDGPDFRAAALLSQAIAKFVPGIHCDIKTILREGETIENNIKAIRHGRNKISPYR
jgi:uncharacterized protein